MKIISIKKNIIANYIGQAYVMILGIVITPLYLKYMGAEQYGLIGFFIILQMWLNLLDAGLSSTLGREVAYARGAENGFLHFHKILKSFEAIFLFLAIINIIVIYNYNNVIATNWLNSTTLDIKTISYCIFLMGIMISLRWFVTLYKSGLNGFEDQVWINKINILFSSFKYIGSLLIIIFISSNIEVFFKYQFMIGAIELIIYTARFYFNLKKKDVPRDIFGFNWRILRKILPFSTSIAYTTILWTIIMQLDKLVLSGILSLSNYGYFSIVVLVASSIIALSTPIFLAVIPKMTKLFSENKLVELIDMYKTMTLFTTWIIMSISLTIFSFSKEIMYILTGDISAAIWSSDILSWYVLGYGIYVLGSFQYYLQNIFGNLKLYNKGLSIGTIFYVPVMFFISKNYEVVDLAIFWFIFTIIWFVVFTSIVHNKFLPKFNFIWLKKDILPLIVTQIIITYLVHNLFVLNINEDISRLFLLAQIIAITLLTILLTSFSLKSIRLKYMQYLRE